MIAALASIAILMTSFLSWMLISGAVINTFIKDQDKALIAFIASALLWAYLGYCITERFVK